MQLYVYTTYYKENVPRTLKVSEGMSIWDLVRSLEHPEVKDGTAIKTVDTTTEVQKGIATDAKLSAFREKIHHLRVYKPDGGLLCNLQISRTHVYEECVEIVV